MRWNLQLKDIPLLKQALNKKVARVSIEIKSLPTV